MPAATSSRQRRRREPSSDAIEEDGPSQSMGDEDLDDGETEVVRRPRKSKKPTVTRPQPSQKEQEGEADEPVDIVKNFTDQPLDRAQIQKLGGVAEDWSMIRRQIHANSFTLVKDVGANLAEFADGDKGEKALLEIDNVMRQLLDTESELRSHEDTIRNLMQQLTRGEDVANVIEHYEEGIQQMASAYKTKTSRQKYSKSEEYLKFRQALFEVQNPDTAMPPLTDLIPRENGDDSDDEDDVQVGGVTQDYKCPLTLTILVNPLTSSVCGHSFSAESIREFFGNKASVTCPASGCRQNITLNSLKPNKELAKQAQNAARRERARNDDDDESDEDEVIE